MVADYDNGPSSTAALVDEPSYGAAPCQYSEWVRQQPWVGFGASKQRRLGNRAWLWVGGSGGKAYSTAQPNC